MKNFLSFMFLVIAGILSAQKIDSVKFNTMLNNKLASANIGDLFKPDPNSVIGFIGSNYQRFQVYFASVTKDKKNPNVYNVKGKSMVKNNICDFSGTITITKAVEA